MIATLSLLANEFTVGRILHVQVSLAALNHISVVHEILNGCESLKIH